MTVAEKVLNLLNDAFDHDPRAIHALCCNRVPCNDDLMHHETIQVDVFASDCGFATVGMLGVMNGLCVPDGKYIALNFEEIDGIRKPSGFVLLDIDQI